MASEVLSNISKDTIEQLRLMSELKYELDTQSRLAHAKEEGIQQGMQEIIDKLKTGESPDEIIRNYENNISS